MNPLTGLRMKSGDFMYSCMAGSCCRRKNQLTHINNFYVHTRAPQNDPSKPARRERERGREGEREGGREGGRELSVSVIMHMAMDLTVRLLSSLP